MFETEFKNPVACTLNGAEFHKRRALARRLFLSEIKSSRRIKNGVMLEFKPTSLTRSGIEGFIKLEQQCCSFLTFDVSFESENEDVPERVIITSPPGGEMVIDLFVKAIEEYSA